MLSQACFIFASPSWLRAAQGHRWLFFALPPRLAQCLARRRSATDKCQAIEEAREQMGDGERGKLGPFSRGQIASTVGTVAPSGVCLTLHRQTDHPQLTEIFSSYFRALTFHPSADNPAWLPGQPGKGRALSSGEEVCWRLDSAKEETAVPRPGHGRARAENIVANMHRAFEFSK